MEMVKGCGLGTVWSFLGGLAVECGDFRREDGGSGVVVVEVRRMERRREELGVEGTIRWSGE